MSSNNEMETCPRCHEDCDAGDLYLCYNANGDEDYVCEECDSHNQACGFCGECFDVEYEDRHRHEMPEDWDKLADEMCYGFVCLNCAENEIERIKNENELK